MSIRLMSLIFQAHFGNLELDNRIVRSHTAKFVLVALADHANDEGESAYPSVETLASKTDISVRAVGYALEALEKAGIIHRAGKSKFRTITYTIDIAALMKLTEVPPIYGGESDDIISASDAGTSMQVIQPMSASDAEKSVSLADKSSFKPSIKHARTTEEMKAQTSASLQKFYERQKKGGIDLYWLDEGLIHYAEAFTRAFGSDIVVPKSERNLWRKVLQEWQQIGLSDDIIEATVAKMRRENLTVSGPQSVTKIARDMMAKSAQGQPDFPPVFHVEGVTADEFYKNYKRT